MLSSGNLDMDGFRGQKERGKLCGSRRRAVEFHRVESSPNSQVGVELARAAVHYLSATS